MAGIRKTLSGKQSAGKAPISSHPLFPAIVALWFAALLGLGTLVLPAALLEQLFGITSFTGRFMMAIGAGVLGAVSGVFLARKVADAGGDLEQAGYAAEYTAPVKMPISALEELGSEGLDEPIAAADMPAALIRGRRRALTAGQEEYADLGSFSVYDQEFADIAEEETAAEAPLELEESAASDVAARFEPAEDAWTDEFEDKADNTHFDELVLDQPEPDDAFLRSDEGDTGASRAFDRPFNPALGAETDVSADEPVVDARRFDAPAFSAPLENDAAADTPKQAPAPADQPKPVKGQTAAELLTGKSLGELGMVELVERFALSLQSNAPTAINVAEDGDIADLVPHAAPETAMDSAPIAPTDTAAQPDKLVPAAIPAFMRPIDPDADFDSEFEDDEDDWEDDTHFSSLLAMKGAFSAPLAPSEAEDDETGEDEVGPAPVALFAGPDQRRAGQETADTFSSAPPPTPLRTAGKTGEAERALRDALEKLQKMSGAA